MTSNPVYLDYAATTPTDPAVIEAMAACLGASGNFGNPATPMHTFGRNARSAVELARRQVADLIGAQAHQIVWTSGATESNNLAIKGLTEHGRRQSTGGKCHIITSTLEHKAVLDTMQYVQQQGFDVTYLQPDAHGIIQPEAVRNALRSDTLLVSVMLVNNEIGTITDVAQIGEIVRRHGALMHVDAAQATGKLPIDLGTWQIDLLSMSAHKTYGPKGIGALYVGPRAKPVLRAQMHGGGHEQGLRSGTLATHQIVGMGQAYAIARETMEQDVQRIKKLRDGFLARLDSQTYIRNAPHAPTVPHTLSLTITAPAFVPGMLGDTVALSSTSACSSANGQASHVLLGIGLDNESALRTVRISFGRYTTEEEVMQAADALTKAVRDAEENPSPAMLFLS